MALICGASLQAATLIYEPFADSDTTLDGNASGTGLSGTWVASTMTVDAPTLSYGTLDSSGN
ncbi:hypothetical protein, partial [Haloferula sp. A504]|uniref:hypothetical protein n=1 Tax=Haloferula sp. A504 TaxID=3373601 RepID=UPI0031C79135|nr:hypothetical protein [Verrucomicrobiaceae bacterium E54]